MLYAGAGTAIDSLSRFPALQNIVSTCAHLRSNLRSLIFVFLVEWQKQWHCLCYPFVLFIASSIVLMLCRLLEKEFKGYLFTARANEIVKIYTCHCSHTKTFAHINCTARNSMDSRTKHTTSLGSSGCKNIFGHGLPTLYP